MYALVYFPDDKSSSVVLEKLIQWPRQNIRSECENAVKPNINDIVEVLWGDKFITGKILYKSTNKTYLEKLVVGENGELKGQTKTQMRGQALANFSKKRNIETEKKISKEARDTTQKMFNEFLITSSRSGQINSEPSSIESRAALSDEGENNTHLVNEQREEPNCAFCSSIPVTAEVITALEMILSHLKMRFQAISDKEPNNVATGSASLTNAAKEKPMHWEIPGLGKTRLIENVDVWMDSGHLMIIKESTKSNPNEMVRKLLIFLIGEQALAGLSALGHSAKPAINSKIYTAVKGYIMKHAEEIDHTFPFNRVINQLCASRAAKYGNQKPLKKSGECSAKTALQNVPIEVSRGTLGKKQQTVTEPKEFHVQAPINYNYQQPSTSYFQSSNSDHYSSRMQMEPRYGDEPGNPYMETDEPSYCSL